MMDTLAMKIGYVVSDLKQVGPTNQTLNIIKYSGAIHNCVVFTLFEEPEDTCIADYLAEGITIVCLKQTRKTVLLSGYHALAQALSNYNIELVHSYGTFADTVSHYVCSRLHIPHLITLRNFPMEDMTTRMPRAIGLLGARAVLHILKHSEHVICCSKSIMLKMKTAYGWNNLSYIQNGVDLTKYYSYDKQEMRRKLGFEKDDLIFIATGSIIPRKRIDETADAFVAANLPENAYLLFLGDGYLLESMKEKYKNHNQIQFLGKKTNVAEYLSAADVFVSSSESEGMPNAVLEALACNVPTILSDIPQHLEVLSCVQDCGLVYTLGQKDQLADVFISCFEHEALKERACAHKIRTSELTMENMGRKYRDFYIQMLGE